MERHLQVMDADGFIQFWRQCGKEITIKLVNAATAMEPLEEAVKKVMATTWNDAYQLAMLRAFLIVRKMRSETPEDEKNIAVQTIRRILGIVMLKLSEMK